MIRFSGGQAHPMNNFTLTFCAVLLGFALCGSVFLQTSGFSEEEFDRIHKSALAKLESLPHRILRERTTAFRTNRSAGHTFELIEIVPPNKKKRSVLSDSFKGKPTFERIWIDSRYFERSNGKKWLEPDVPISPGSPDSRKVTKKEFFFLGVTMVNNEQVRVFETLEEGANPSNPIEARKFKIRTRYWFDSDGKLLKSAFQMDVGNGFIRWDEESNYQYDPNIMIEAPIK